MCIHKIAICKCDFLCSPPRHFTWLRDLQWGYMCIPPANVPRSSSVGQTCASYRPPVNIYIYLYMYVCSCATLKCDLFCSPPRHLQWLRDLQWGYMCIPPANVPRYSSVGAAVAALGVEASFVCLHSLRFASAGIFDRGVHKSSSSVSPCVASYSIWFIRSLPATCK